MGVHTHVDLGWRSSVASLRQQQPLFSPGKFCREGITAQHPGYLRCRLVRGTQAGHDNVHADTRPSAMQRLPRTSLF